MNNQKLINFFQMYTNAFKSYDINAVQQCYQLPCALHTPDKILYIENNEQFNEAFIDIFTVLQHAKIQQTKILKASYCEQDTDSVDVCIDWAFIDDTGEVFADFCAFYHIVMSKQQYKIINVVSHELSNSVELSSPLIFKNE